MTQRLRQVKHARRLKALQWAIALAIGTSVCGSALAMRVGHSRVVSTPGAPLQAVVALQDVTAEELATLKVSVADDAAWQRAGLKPPVPLASMVVKVEDGTDGARKNLRIRSTQAPASGAVDLLLDISSSSGQRQVQVSILVPLRGAGADVTRATVGATARAGGASGTVTVKSGDYLFAIAQRHAVPNASVYQMLVALWRANPDAFIQNNMNLVRTGKKLQIPDAATVRAVDPAEARRIFNEHAEAYAKYRARAGAAAGANPSVVKGQSAASGTVSAAGSSDVASAASAQDRVRLSTGQTQDGASAQADAQADVRASTERALADAQARVSQLQTNVDELNKAVAQKETAAGTQTTASAQAQGSAGAPTATGAQSASGAAATSGSSATSGSAGTAGGPTVSGAGTAAADGAGTPGAAASGAAGKSGDATAPVATVASGSEAAAPGSAASSSVSQPAAPAAADRVGKPADSIAKSDMPAWLADNLLVIVTAVLALVAFAIAWLLRRAGARRGDDDEETYAYNEPALDTAALNRKLDTINLDLDEPPTDEPRRVSGPRV